MRHLYMSTAMLVITSLAFVPSSVLAKKKTSPENINGATTIDAKKAKQLFDEGIVFIDVRKDKNFAAGRVPDAFHIDLQNIYHKNTLDRALYKSQPIVIYCDNHNCLRSAKATEKAVTWGYQNVYYFRDGFSAWKSSGYPVE